MKILFSVTALITIFLFSSCVDISQEKLSASYARLEQISQARWEALSQKKIYFGHMSVGTNIVEGLKEVIARKPVVKMEIRETSSLAAFSEPVFAHSLIGMNKAPHSKIDAFRDIIQSGVGQATDIAFFKFCYVDIDHETDIDFLFKSYVELVDDLGSRFPNLKILTFTVPLLSRPVGIKIRLKKILGRLPWYEEDNIQRDLFNDMLRARFKGSLFDLAAAEARIDDVKRATFEKDGKRYDLLYRGFTNDGGHLNSTGRQVVAVELLRALADL